MEMKKTERQTNSKKDRKINIEEKYRQIDKRIKRIQTDKGSRKTDRQTNKWSRNTERQSKITYKQTNEEEQYKQTKGVEIEMDLPRRPPS